MKQSINEELSILYFCKMNFLSINEYLLLKKINNNGEAEHRL